MKIQFVNLNAYSTVWERGTKRLFECLKYNFERQLFELYEMLSVRSHIGWKWVVGMPNMGAMPPSSTRRLLRTNREGRCRGPVPKRTIPRGPSDLELLHYL